MRLASKLLIAAVFLAGSSAAMAASSDRPVSSDGTSTPAPKAEANAWIKPSFGKSGGVESAAAEGTIAAPPSDPSANGLSTVAYGAFGPQPESVISWDSRRRVYTNAYPSRAIVYIEYNGAHHCTGWMYSPRMVVTAGHCVHPGGGGSSKFYKASLFKVYAAKDGAASPYGFCTVNRLHSVIGWTQNKNFRFDYGAMRLNCTVGNSTGWFGLYAPDPTNQAMIVSGYPGDKPKDQWTSSDKIRAVSTEMIAYRADTVGGHSGSPVWNDRDEGTASTGAWAFGVHNYGVGAFGSNTNAAARLTSVRIQNYINWRDQP